MEDMLRNTEFVCACLPLERYPRKTLDALWKQLLTNQFHDILPGSSIHMVYEDTLREYEEIESACRGLLAEAAGELMEKDAGAVTLLNTLSHPHTSPVLLPASWKGCEVLDAQGRPVPVQDEDDAAVALPDLPALSFTTLRRGGPRTGAPEMPEGLVLENREVRYEFAEDATLVRAVDKLNGRELLPDGEPGNRFSLYVDRPHDWDAWDIDIYYEDEWLGHAAPVSVEPLRGGAVRKGLRFELSIGNSRILQSVYLAGRGRRLDFETRVDWKEFHRMLRVAFPTRVRATDATFDIQYGYVQRPTHRNTGWDLARFEVCGHRYVDLSDASGGMALLNDCKYGHKVKDHVIDLNLLRAPSDPDPDADLGEHTFTYSLLPHPEVFLDADVIAEAAMLNRPPVIFDGYAFADGRLPCRLDGEGISLEVLKKAEKEEERVVRLVETRGRRSRGTLILAEPTARAVETDLLEWEDGPESGARVEVELAPFEIRTYRIRA
jgi:alpha-mannosidase